MREVCLPRRVAVQDNTAKKGNNQYSPVGRRKCLVTIMDDDNHSLIHCVEIGRQFVRM